MAGARQVVTGTAFQPLTVRVTDSSTPPNPVLGASVLFQSTVLRPAGNNLALRRHPFGHPDGNARHPGAEQSTVLSDINGLASFIPSVGSFTGPLEIEIQVSAGTTAALQDVMESFPAASSGNTSPHQKPVAWIVYPAVRGTDLLIPRDQ